MKNTQAALGLIAVLATGSAMAQSSVIIGGIVDAFAGSTKNSGDKARRAVVGSGGLTTSWFGFKAVEDLGGGLKAEMALTGFFLADSGTSGRFGGDNLFSRDANIGISGSFGKVALGRNLAPNFLPTIISNPFGDSFNFSPLVVHANVPTGNFAARSWTASNAGDTGWSNEIIYTTPDFSGFKANLHYQFGEVAGDSGRKNVGVNALYFNGPLALTAFYHDVRVANPNAGAIIDVTATPFNFGSINRQKTYFVGGNYDLKLVKLFATYQQSDDDTTTIRTMKDRLYSLGLSVPVGGGNILAGYANTKRTGDLVGADLKRDTATIGYDYFLSKRTDLYANLMNDRLTSYKNGTSFGVGMRHRF